MRAFLLGGPDGEPSLEPDGAVLCLGAPVTRTAGLGVGKDCSPSPIVCLSVAGSSSSSSTSEIAVLAEVEAAAEALEPAPTAMGGGSAAALPPYTVEPGTRPSHRISVVIQRAFL